MKKFFTILMAMIFATSVFAQKPLEPSNITDNISVTVKAGVSTPLHHSFTTIDPLVGLEFNKMITPTFGLGVEGEWTIKDACNAAENIRFEHQYVGVRTITNVMNLFGGYKGYRRVFEIDMILGVGWGHIYGHSDNPYVKAWDKNFVETKTELNFNVNLGEFRQHTVSFRPGVVWNMHTHDYQADYSINRANLQLAVAYTYHFKNSNGTHGFIFSDKLYTQAQMDAMNDQINDLRKQRDDANKRVDECLLIIRDLQGANETLSNELKKSNDNEIPEVPDSPIGFKQGSYEINETSLPMIKDLAEFMKSNNKTYVISGYASVEGTKEFNQKLSEQRADAIKDQLIKFGVSPDRLETRAFGATDEFGTKPFNRIVITTVK